MSKNLQKALESSKDKNVEQIELILELEKYSDSPEFSFHSSSNARGRRAGILYEQIFSEICKQRFGYSDPSAAFAHGTLQEFFIMNDRSPQTINQTMDEINKGLTDEFEAKNYEKSYAKDNFKDYYNKVIPDFDLSSLKCVQDSYEEFSRVAKSYLGENEEIMSFEIFALTLRNNPSLFYDENTNDVFDN